MKRSRLVLVVILVAIAVLGISLWVNEGPLWQWVMTRRGPVEPCLAPGLQDGHLATGWATYKRWTNEWHGPAAAFYDNGYVAARATNVDGVTVRYTHWNYDCTIALQGTDTLIKDEPPWLRGMTDQAEPTAPRWGKE